MPEENQHNIDKQTESPAIDSQSTPPVVAIQNQQAAEASYKHHSELFGSGVAKTNTVLLAWAASLVVMLIAYVVPLSIKLAKLSQLDTNLRQGEKYIKNQSTPSQEGPAPKSEKIKNVQTDVARVRVRVKEKEEERAKLESELSVIRTPLGDVPIPLNYLPLVWLSLFTGLFVFFLYKRVVLLSSLAHIIDIHTRQRGKPIEEVKGLGSWAPFWLSPLPTVLSERPTSTIEFSQFLGWEPGGVRRRWLCYSCVAVSAGVYAWVLWVLFRVSKTFSDPQDGRRLCIVGLVTAVACILTAVWGFWPTINLRTFPERLIEHSNRRRRFLMIGGSVAALAFVYTLMPRGFLPRWLTHRSPRKKKRPRSIQEPLQEEFRNTFQLNSVSGTIHYIDAAGLTYERVNPSNKLTRLSVGEVITTLTDANSGIAQQLQNKSKAFTQRGEHPSGMAERRREGSEALKPHFTAKRAGSLIECLAIEKAQEGDIAQSLQLLWTGVRQNAERAKRITRNPSYRLYDLFARLASESSNSAELSKLIDFVRTSWGDDESLNQRTKRWLDPSSRWTKKTSGNKLNWQVPNKPKAGGSYCKS